MSDTTTPATPTVHHPIALRTASVLGWFFAGAGVMSLLPVPFDVAFATAWALRADVDGIGDGR